MFLSTRTITKTDFFYYFNTFYIRTFTPKLCISVFKKASLIPFNPNIVLDQIAKVGWAIEETEEEVVAREPSLSLAFVTPPPRPWTEFYTLITYT